MSSVTRSESWWIGISREQWPAAVAAQAERFQAVSLSSHIEAINAYRMATWGTGIPRSPRGREL